VRISNLSARLAPLKKKEVFTMSELPAATDGSAPALTNTKNSPALELGSPRFLFERALVGLGLASLFGLALGMHRGSLALVTHALAIPAGLLLTTAVSLPSLYIALAMLGVPLRLSLLLAAVSTALHHAGRVLAGLAPVAALLVVTIREPVALSVVARFGLQCAGILTLYRLIAALREADARTGTLVLFSRGKSGLVMCGFVFLVVNLAQIAFSTFLPVLRGVS
jgi:hypothetical protein